MITVIAESYRWFDENNVQKPRPISVQVRGTIENLETDTSKELKQNFFNLAEDIVRDDLGLGLKLISPKVFPKKPMYAYPLKPVRHHIFMSNNTMFINYASRINVEVQTGVGGTALISPDWKNIYLSTVGILDKYREEKQ